MFRHFLAYALVTTSLLACTKGADDSSNMKTDLQSSDESDLAKSIEERIRIPSLVDMDDNDVTKGIRLGLDNFSFAAPKSQPYIKDAAFMGLPNGFVSWNTDGTATLFMGFWRNDSAKEIEKRWNKMLEDAEVTYPSILESMRLVAEAQKNFSVRIETSSYPMYQHICYISQLNQITSTLDAVAAAGTSFGPLYSIRMGCAEHERNSKAKLFKFSSGEQALYVYPQSTPAEVIQAMSTL